MSLELNGCALYAGLSKAVLLEPHISGGIVKRFFASDACWHIAIGCVVLVGVLSAMLVSEHELRLAAKQLVSNSKQHFA